MLKARENPAALRFALYASISGKFESSVKLSATFDRLRAANERALVLYITAGDPSFEQLPDVLDTLQEGGADIIEIGLPFSDPIADGPTIQASNQRALERGVNPNQVLDALAQYNPAVPLVLMGYYNPVLRRGLAEFAAASQRAHVAGTIISDLTPEESDDWMVASQAHDLDTVFLAAPTSTDHRLDEVCRRSTGFVYAVSRTGVTGTQASDASEVASLVNRIKARTQVPVCVGFGISQPDHVRSVCEVADGAVVGSWLVNELAQNWNQGAGRHALVESIKKLKAATR